MTVRPPAPLTPLEIASGVVLGHDRAVQLPDLGLPPATPRQAFEATVAQALRRPPCLVSFSGGRDSSAVLAVAIEVARRQGLPEPVAVTLRFPTIPSADEGQWQERVVRHLGVREWERVDLRDADLLGSAARAELDRHGLLYPANAFVHGPLAERAAGGTLVTGVGGDEVMTAARRWNRLSRVLAGRRRPGMTDLRDALVAIAPRPVRRRDVRRRVHFDPVVPWLRPDAAALVRRHWEDELADGPVRYDRMLARFTGSRARLLGLATLDTIAHSRGAATAHPFATPQFLAALAVRHGTAGPRSRSEGMADLFADVLPDDVLRRSTKAIFNDAFWGPTTQTFVRTWNGKGLDKSLVDVSALRRAWAGNDSDYRGFLLLHSAWTATRAGARSTP